MIVLYRPENLFLYPAEKWVNYLKYSHKRTALLTAAFTIPRFCQPLLKLCIFTFS